MGLVNILVSTVLDGICASDTTVGSVSLAGALGLAGTQTAFC